MNDCGRPVRLDDVRWVGVLPWLRLFRTFRLAVDLPKLFLGLLLVVTSYLAGHALDASLGSRGYIGEIDVYRRMEPADFTAWRDTVNHDAGRGAFSVALSFALEAFDRGVNAATGLRFGVSQLLRGDQGDPQTVAIATRDLVITLPGWMFTTQPVFAVFYGLIVLVLTAIFGGAIVRMAAVEVTDHEPVSALAGIRFVWRYLTWFLVTPLMPLIFIAAAGLVLTVGGLVFFNLPALVAPDVAGALAFVFALLIGLVIALVALLTAGGVHLFYPALACEGTDGFDAVSRAFSYVAGRPWHWLFYTVVSIVYGAITYLFVGAVIFLALLVTHHAVRWGVLLDAADGMNRLDMILPPPRLGQLMYVVDWNPQLTMGGRIAAGIVWVWVFLLTGFLGAFAISFYYCANTVIYLLLRQSMDGTAFEEVTPDPEPQDEGATPPPMPDKVEPAEAGKASEGGN